MVCTYGYSHFRHFQTVKEMEIYIFFFIIMFLSLLSQFWKGIFCSKEGVSQYFCPYSVCTHMSLVFGEEFLAHGLAFKVTPEVFSWD